MVTFVGSVIFINTLLLLLLMC
uniref:NADH dehydrogenase subunit 4L n=1 Tax=Heterorhabditis bacteriophora TaxID=37862 RepID=A0A1I7WEE4_HETBA